MNLKIWIPLDPWRDESPFGPIEPPPPKPKGHWAFLPWLFLVVGCFAVVFWMLVHLAEALKNG